MIAARRLHVCFPEKSYGAPVFLTFEGRSGVSSSVTTRFLEPPPRTEAKSAGGGGSRRVTLGNLPGSVLLVTSRALPLPFSGESTALPFPFPCSRDFDNDDDDEGAGGGCEGTEVDTGRLTYGVFGSIGRYEKPGGTSPRCAASRKTSISSPRVWFPWRATSISWEYATSSRRR